MDVLEERARPTATRLADRGHWVIAALRPLSLPLLRISLGVVFVWFGLLKLTNSTPIGALVAGVVPFDPSWFVPLLGAVEVLLGAALVAGRWLSTVGAVLMLHLSGTFLVLVTQPSVAFQHDNPLLLTTEGEFVVKNLVLIAAGLVVACHRRDRADTAGPAASSTP
jgi:uncharacterized membrane protein YkgB